MKKNKFFKFLLYILLLIVVAYIGGSIYIYIHNKNLDCTNVVDLKELNGRCSKMFYGGNSQKKYDIYYNKILDLNQKIKNSSSFIINEDHIKLLDNFIITGMSECDYNNNCTAKNFNFIVKDFLINCSLKGNTACVNKFFALSRNLNVGINIKDENEFISKTKLCNTDWNNQPYDWKDVIRKYCQS